jgi:hypothetical protein
LNVNVSLKKRIQLYIYLPAIQYKLKRTQSVSRKLIIVHARQFFFIFFFIFVINKKYNLVPSESRMALVRLLPNKYLRQQINTLKLWSVSLSLLSACIGWGRPIKQKCSLTLERNFTSSNTTSQWKYSGITCCMAIKYHPAL